MAIEGLAVYFVKILAVSELKELVMFSNNFFELQNPRPSKNKQANKHDDRYKQQQWDEE